MDCLLYPKFQVEIPIVLNRNILDQGCIAKFEVAINEFQKHKIKDGREYYLPATFNSSGEVDKDFRIKIKKICYDDILGECYIELEDDRNMMSVYSSALCEKATPLEIEDLYISKDLKFVLRGNILKNKSDGRITQIEVNNIQPIFKGKVIEATDDVDVIVNKFISKVQNTEIFSISKSVSEPMVSDIEMGTQLSIHACQIPSYLLTGSYIHTNHITKIAVTGSYSIDVKPRINYGELVNIFEEMKIKQNATTNPIVSWMNHRNNHP